MPAEGSSTISKAQGRRELNQAVSQVIAGLWAEVEPDRDRLLVEFELTGPSETTLPGGITPMFASRPALPHREGSTTA